MATQSPTQSVAAAHILGQNAVPGLASLTSSFDAATSGNSGSASKATSSGGTSVSGVELATGGRKNAGASNGAFQTMPDAGTDRHGETRGLCLTASLERMPVTLGVSIPVRDFRIRDLLALKAGELIETQWAQGEDLPLSSGDVQLAWSEFEVVDTRLAVRVTRLA